jgi:hypothetical protein
MSALTRDRLEKLRVCAETIERTMDDLQGQLVKLRHDQASFKTAILALQHELEVEDIARAAHAEGVSP